MKLNNPLNLYRLFLFIASFVSILLNNSDFYNILKLLLGSICLIFVLTYKAIWIKKKKNIIIYYFNLLLFYIFNLIYIFLIVMSMFN